LGQWALQFTLAFNCLTLAVRKLLETDRHRQDYYGNTALCTKVHHMVKTSDIDDENGLYL